MGVVVLNGDPVHGIPENCHYRVESLPDRIIVDEGECSGELAVSVHPGKYVYALSKHLYDNCWFTFQDEFVHGVTEENYAKVSRMKPAFSKVRQTSDGNRYICGFGGCSFTTGSSYAMVAHEGEHQGIDILAKGAEIKMSESSKKAKAGKSA